VRTVVEQMLGALAESGVLLAVASKNDPAAAAEWAETQKLSNDPRVTSIGQLLRATSLDELPQLLNVLIGHMSLVGSKPQPYELAADLPSIDARPGIVPPVEDSQGKLGLKVWLKSLWSAIKSFWL